MVLNCIGGVMPQEYLTVKYARHFGFGAPIYWPLALARFLDELDRDPSRLHQLRAAAAACHPRQHPTDILRYLDECAASISRAAAAARRRPRQPLKRTAVLPPVNWIRPS